MTSILKNLDPILAHLAVMYNLFLFHIFLSLFNPDHIVITIATAFLPIQDALECNTHPNLMETYKNEKFTQIQKAFESPFQKNMTIL